jgi:LysM repeat protein
MTKWLLFVFFTIITSCSLLAQNSLEIKGTSPDLYLKHTVLPKESIYSVGRLYNVSPKELAAYNHLQMESGLSVGQELKIPLDKNNFTQSDAKAGTDELVPVYHIVEPKETLYRLFVNYNKVPITSLQKWNNLQSDALSEGSQMIVGYLKVDKAQSSLAAQTINGAGQVAVAPKPEEKKNEPAVEKAVIKAPDPVKKETSVAPAGESNVTVRNVNTKSSVNFSGGYFRKVYDQQVENKSPLNNSGSGGIFKSTSGWQDGKYYCFNNDAAPGSIVKVTDNASGKSVYAKVLDAIPDIKQNAGLSVILSNAAAEELGAGENKFDCVVSYVK